MSSTRAKPPWQRKIEARMSAVEERIAREIRRERHLREVDGAHTDEEIEAIGQRLEALANEQVRLMARLRWVEARLPPAGRPKATKKN